MISNGTTDVCRIRFLWQYIASLIDSLRAAGQPPPSCSLHYLFQFAGWSSTLPHPFSLRKQVHRTCPVAAQQTAHPARRFRIAGNTNRIPRLADLTTGKPLCYVVGLVQ